MASKKTVPAPRVIVRAYSGVFVGDLEAKTGGPETFAVTLAKARHVWSWQSNGLPRKALTIEDLALLGAGSGTKISGEVPSLEIADVKVIVGLSDEAAKRFAELPCLT
jgi:hypothetical protein